MEGAIFVGSLERPGALPMHKYRGRPLSFPDLHRADRHPNPALRIPRLIKPSCVPSPSTSRLYTIFFARQKMT